MLFAIEARDRPGALETRLATRPDHVAYLKGLGEKLVFAGPFLDADEKPNGSLVVINVATMEEAEAVAAADPYVEADLFSSTEIRRWNWAINKPEGV